MVIFAGDYLHAVLISDLITGSGVSDEELKTIGSKALGHIGVSRPQEADRAHFDILQEGCPFCGQSDGYHCELSTRALTSHDQMAQLLTSYIK